MDIKSPLPSLLHHNTHAPPPTLTTQPAVSKATTDSTGLFQLDTLGRDKVKVKNSMGNQDCMTDSLCNLHRQSSDTTPSLSQNAALKKKKAYTLPPLRYGNNHKSADFAGYDDPTRTIPTDELALFMRNKKRYCPPNFKPIPPLPGGWIPPVQEIAWESTCHTDDSPFLHIRSFDGPLDLPWKKTTTPSVMPARYRPLLVQKTRLTSSRSKDDAPLQTWSNGSVFETSSTSHPTQPSPYFDSSGLAKQQQRAPTGYLDLSSPPPSSNSHPKQHQRASTGYLDPPPPPPCKQQHLSYFEPPPPCKQQHPSYFVPPPPLFTMAHYKQRPPPSINPSRPTSFDPPPWTAPLGTFSPWESPPPSTWRRHRSMDPTPTKHTPDDLDLLMDDRSISILRVLDDDDPPVHHRLYYNISDYVVVSDA